MTGLKALVAASCVASLPILSQMGAAGQITPDTAATMTFSMVSGAVTNEFDFAVTSNWNLVQSADAQAKVQSFIIGQREKLTISDASGVEVTNAYSIQLEMRE